MDFKFRKRDNCFIWHENGIGSMIELDHWIRDNMLTIYPIYMVRFDILKKWFEAYSFKTLRDQRDNPSVGFSGNMLERQDKFILRSPLLIRNIVNYVTLSRSVLR